MFDTFKTTVYVRLLISICAAASLNAHAAQLVPRAADHPTQV
jgi:hypothetical protein